MSLQKIKWNHFFRGITLGLVLASSAYAMDDESYEGRAPAAHAPVSSWEEKNREQRELLFKLYSIVNPIKTEFTYLRDICERLRDSSEDTFRETLAGCAAIALQENLTEIHRHLEQLRGVLEYYHSHEERINNGTNRKRHITESIRTLDTKLNDNFRPLLDLTREESNFRRVFATRESFLILLPIITNIQVNLAEEFRKTSEGWRPFLYPECVPIPLVAVIPAARAAEAPSLLPSAQAAAPAARSQVRPSIELNGAQRELVFQVFTAAHTNIRVQMDGIEQSLKTAADDPAEHFGEDVNTYFRPSILTAIQKVKTTLDVPIENFDELYRRFKDNVGITKETIPDFMSRLFVRVRPHILPYLLELERNLSNPYLAQAVFQTEARRIEGILEGLNAIYAEFQLTEKSESFRNALFSSESAFVASQTKAFEWVDEREPRKKLAREFRSGKDGAYYRAFKEHTEETRKHAHGDEAIMSFSYERSRVFLSNLLLNPDSILNKLLFLNNLGELSQVHEKKDEDTIRKIKDEFRALTSDAKDLRALNDGFLTMDKHNHHFSVDVPSSPRDLFFQALAPLMEIQRKYPKDFRIAHIMFQVRDYIEQQNRKCAAGLLGRAALVSELLADLLITALEDVPLGTE